MVSIFPTINRVINHIKSTDSDFFLFRGHNDNKWELNPSLYRVRSDYTPDALESNIYTDFKSNCGPLYDRYLNSWEILFEIRHSGLPTRLLDWSENFSSALFFALKGVDWVSNKKDYQPCIWILDPYELNKAFLPDEGIPLVEELPFEYEEILNDYNLLYKNNIFGPFTFLASRSQQRIFAQKSVFTFHDEKHGPLEKMCSSCLKRIDIPIKSIKSAMDFLNLAGTNEYSLYPDLDGLGRLLIDRLNIKND